MYVFLSKMGIISETVRATTQFWDPQRKKTYLTENFNFLSCDLKKGADSALLAQKGHIWETVRARAKLTKFWITEGKKLI